MAKSIKIIPVLLLLISCITQAQEKWVQKRNEEGIEVYTRKLANDSYKEIKVVSVFNATVNQLIKIVKDVDKHKDWIYNTRQSYLVARKGPDTIFYYTEVSLPWPASNRDVVIQLTFNRDTINNVMKIEALGIPGMVAQKKNIVRIPYSYSQWKVNRLNAKQIKIEYTLKINPGGFIPAWLVNYTAVIAPLSSFKKLRKLVESAKS